MKGGQQHTHARSGPALLGRGRAWHGTWMADRHVYCGKDCSCACAAAHRHAKTRAARHNSCPQPGGPSHLPRAHTSGPVVLPGWRAQQSAGSGPSAPCCTPPHTCGEARQRPHPSSITKGLRIQARHHMAAVGATLISESRVPPGLTSTLGAGGGRLFWKARASTIPTMVFYIPHPPIVHIVELLMHNLFRSASVQQARQEALLPANKEEASSLARGTHRGRMASQLIPQAAHLGTTQ